MANPATIRTTPRCSPLTPHGLQVELAESGRRPTRLAEHAHEGARICIQRQAVGAKSVGRGPSTGHDRGAIGHAHRIGDEGSREADT